jgi:hypothetical protein
VPLPRATAPNRTSSHRHVRMGRNLQLSRPTTPYGLICAPPPIGHRAQNDGYFALIVVQGAAGSDELNIQMTMLAVAQQGAVELRSS